MREFETILIIAGLAVLAIAIFYAQQPGIDYPDTPCPPGANCSPPIALSSDLKTFNSWQEAVQFLQATGATGRGYGVAQIAEETTAMPLTATRTAAASGAAAPDFSTTNIQVAGVDEADLFKTDGNYIYTLSGGKIVIAKAYPPTEASVVSVINESAFTAFFINGDKLIAFGQEEFNWEPIIQPLAREFENLTAPQTQTKTPVSDIAIARPGISIYPPIYASAAFVKIYDVNNRANPVLVKKIEAKGNYITSRMIGNKVYVIFTEYASPVLPMPVYAVDGSVREIQPTEISYFDEPFDSTQFTTVLGFDVSDLNKTESRKVILASGTGSVFVSLENAYVTYTKYNYYYPVWTAYSEVLGNLLDNETLEKLDAIEAANYSQWRKDNLKVQVAQDFLSSLNETQRSELYAQLSFPFGKLAEASRTQLETTVVHKFSLGDSIGYVGQGSVSGRVLNQFSMDEKDGFFRIATTVGEVSRDQRGTPAVNNVYVLNSSLGIVGRLENLAPGERIYSARFMGDRVYLVTFKKVDPLFVISLENPERPVLLGKLKIPGYSDYLHPYDETHLIGLGKDAVPAEEGDFAWYQGVKLSLFDVSNVLAPVELASYKIGDRGTESYALHDHKAFLFDKQRNLLVIPIKLAEINPAKYPQGVDPRSYGDYTFQGAYVFNVTLENGFGLRGRISHADNESIAKAGEYYYGGGTDVRRSAYIGDYLYSVSEKFIKANNLTTLTQVASLELPLERRELIYVI